MTFFKCLLLYIWKLILKEWVFKCIRKSFIHSLDFSALCAFISLLKLPASKDVIAIVWSFSGVSFQMWGIRTPLTPNASIWFLFCHSQPLFMYFEKSPPSRLKRNSYLTLPLISHDYNFYFQKTHFSPYWWKIFLW